MSDLSENANYHSTGGSVFDDRGQDSVFLAYRTAWQKNPKEKIVAPAPLHLDIESTNTCNMNCAHCAAAADHWGGGQKGFMDLSLFQSIIDQAASAGVCCVKFSLRGEPLLHPGLMDMINYTIHSGIMDCYFNTNGMLLDEGMCHTIVQSRIPRISISVDGWSAESYGWIRKGGDYDYVCKNIARLRRVRNQAGSAVPRIRVQAVLTPEMETHRELYISQWSDIADEIGFVDAREEGPEAGGYSEAFAGFCCPFLWQRMTILWDGTLLPCLMHGVEDFSLMAFGNVRDLDIVQAWQSEKENEYRSLHEQGRSHENDACLKCSYRDSEIRKLLRSIENTC